MIRVSPAGKLASACAALALGMSITAGAYAADLVIALKEPGATLDPHFMTSPAAGQINGQIFDGLARRDNDGILKPRLAESWEIKDDLTWIFHLRKNVKWSDGSPFTADDVVFTFGRAGDVPNAPSSFKTYLNQVAKVEALDDHTVRITTKEPAPTLLTNISTVLIVSRKHGGKATTDDYNSGKAVIGTGNYLLKQWVMNDRTVLVKNPNFWGPLEKWDTVTFRVIENDASRIASLMAGDVDAIESVPTSEIERLKEHAAVKVWSRETGRIAYLALDSADEALASGAITGPNGEKLDKNPLGDIRVRQALKLAVDADAIVKRIYRGEAVANGQFVPSSDPSFNPDVRLWKADPGQSTRLIAEAGWAGKFKVNLGVSNNVFQNAVQVAEAIAQSWTRIGVPTTVTQLPYAVFLKQRNERLIPLYLQSYQNNGQAEFLYPTLMHTRQLEQGWGTLNFSRYSSREFDAVVEEGMRTMDDAKRAKLMHRATVIGVHDSVMVPLWLLNEATGTKSSLVYDTPTTRTIYPANISPAKK